MFLDYILETDSFVSKIDVDFGRLKNLTTFCNFLGEIRALLTESLNALRLSS